MFWWHTSAATAAAVCGILVLACYTEGMGAAIRWLQVPLKSVDGTDKYFVKGSTFLAWILIQIIVCHHSMFGTPTGTLRWTKDENGTLSSRQKKS